MITIRPFSNNAPPALLEIWRKKANADPLHYRPLSMDVFQELVLGQPYFDYKGLLIAYDDDNPVGFAHAAFGPNKDKTNIDTQTGVICLVMTVPECEQPKKVAKALVLACEQYLFTRGAKQIYGGASRPCAPFYMGLYGGSEPLGVFDSDKDLSETYLNLGYVQIQKTLRFRLNLADYQTLFTPSSVQWRRKLVIVPSDNIISAHWWQACMNCHFRGYNISAVDRVTDEIVAKIDFLLMDFGNSVGTSKQASLLDIVVEESHRNKGVATYLFGEAIRVLITEEYVHLLEAQAADDDLPTVCLLERLGFQIIENGAIYCK